MNNNTSPKNYGAAVSLCGVFGVLGVHHFYIGNILHGVFDLSLFVGAMFLLSTSETEVLGVVLLAIDFLHTFVVFYKLITEQQKDGSGKLVVITNNKNK
jgi:TM2 domain-containing membrane protein YozV